AMNSARAYVYAVASACDRGAVTRQDAAACCLYASEQATQQALQAIQALGGKRPGAEFRQHRRRRRGGQALR
ncbi:MAG: acyl-CoA dehydrogenase family protein, partial [Pseudomonadota bacterium]